MISPAMKLAVLVFVLASASVLYAQDDELLNSAWPPSPQVKQSNHGFVFSLRAEHWSVALDVDEFTPAFAAYPAMIPAFTPRPVEIDEMIVSHSSALAVAEYEFRGIEAVRLNVWAGGGLEAVGYEIDNTITMVDDTTLPPLAQTMLGEYESSEMSAGGEPFFEGGTSYRHRFGMVDAGLSVSVRVGQVVLEETSSERDTLINSATSTVISDDLSVEHERFTYTYARVRIQAEVGLHPTEGVRPFFGARVTAHGARLDFESVQTTDDLLLPGVEQTIVLDGDTEAALETVVGLSVGADLSSGPVRGRAEIMFVDVEDVGLSVSLGYAF
jgi:hypothetical protein